MPRGLMLLVGLAGLAGLTMTGLLGSGLLVPSGGVEPQALFADEPPAEPDAASQPDAGSTREEDRGAMRFGSRDAAPKAPGAVRLATYNVENLFDDRDDPSLSGRSEDIDDTKPESELIAAAAAIRKLDADVLALQEVESREALIEFRESHLQGLGYEHVVSIDAGDDRGIENAVLSRHPVRLAQVWPGRALGGVHPDLYEGKENWYKGQPLRFRRSPLRVDVEIEGPDGPYTLTLFVVHHKSGRGSGYWREAEARGVLDLIAEIQADDPGRNIAVLGDLNSGPDEEVVGVYAAAGLIDTLAARSPGNPQFVTHESGRTIDFILVNGELAGEILPGTATVLGMPARPEGADWRTTAPPPGYASDHYPVAVDLTPVERD